MLDGEGDGDQDGADEEGRVPPELQILLEEAEIEQLDLPGADGGIRREQRIQDVTRGDAAADCEHRRPGQPVAPHRERGDELGVTHPCGRAVDRGPAGFVGEQPRDLGIGEGLDEAEQNRQRPHQDRRRAYGRGNAADREQHERRHAARHPKRILPANSSMKCRLRHGRSISSCSGADHGKPPSFWSCPRSRSP